MDDIKYTIFGHNPFGLDYEFAVKTELQAEAVLRRIIASGAVNITVNGHLVEGDFAALLGA